MSGPSILTLRGVTSDGDCYGHLLARAGHFDVVVTQRSSILVLIDCGDKPGVSLRFANRGVFVCAFPSVNDARNGLRDTTGLELFRADALVQRVSGGVFQRAGDQEFDIRSEDGAFG